MEIRASVHSSDQGYRAAVGTDGRESLLAIPPKPDGTGSGINGGELLCLALATCYCNDLYREAARWGVALEGVEVEVASEFGAAGEPARRISYTARVRSPAPVAAVEALLRHTDAVAEVQRTVRAGVAVEWCGTPGGGEGG